MARKNERARELDHGRKLRFEARARGEAVILAKRKLRAPEGATVYVRACPGCGHITASLDGRLLAMELACPSCEPLAA